MHAIQLFGSTFFLSFFVHDSMGNSKKSRKSINSTNDFFWHHSGGSSGQIRKPIKRKQKKCTQHLNIPHYYEAKQAHRTKITFREILLLTQKIMTELIFFPRLVKTPTVTLWTSSQIMVMYSQFVRTFLSLLSISYLNIPQIFASDFFFLQKFGRYTLGFWHSGESRL